MCGGLLNKQQRAAQLRFCETCAFVCGLLSEGSVYVEGEQAPPHTLSRGVIGEHLLRGTRMMLRQATYPVKIIIQQVTKSCVVAKRSGVGCCLVP